MKIGFTRALLHLGGLWALAFAQPLFHLLGDQAEFFVARGSRGSDILVLGFGYALVPPLVAAAVVRLLGLVRPVLGLGLHLTLVGALVAALALPPAGDLLGGSAAAVPVALLAGAAVAALYLRTEGLRSVLTVLGVAPAVVLVLFLVVSPVSELIGGSEASGSVAGPGRSATPIVLVILDELPLTTVTDGNGELDAKLFPNLAGFARGATWYRNATTVADVTVEAVPAQLTGELPRPRTLPTSKDHPRSLFTLFSRSHALHEVEPITDICPQKLCREDRGTTSDRLHSLAGDVEVVAENLLLPSDLRKDLEPIDRAWEGFDSDNEASLSDEQAVAQRSKLSQSVGGHLRTTDASIGFARMEAALKQPSKQPPLIMMHSTLPHATWRFLPDGRRYPIPEGDPIGLEEKAWEGRQWTVDQSFQRHVLQVQDADRLLGDLLRTLKASGRFDDAVVVVTADHGASFTPGHRRRWITSANLPEIASVPFIVKLPHQKTAKVSDNAVRTVDVLPTIAKAAGVRVPWKTDGMAADERPVDSSTPISITRAGAPGPTRPLSDVIAWRRRRDPMEAAFLRHGVYEAGPRPDLIGRRVSTVVHGRARARVDDPEAYRRIDDDGAGLPAFVAGSVRGAAADSVLAIAINGRVAATTRVFPDGDSGLFRAVVPPSALEARPGSATVTVLQPVAGGRLRAIGGTG